MSLLIKCDCGKKLSVRDELAGKKVKCPACAKVLVAPTPAAEEAATEVMAVEPATKRAPKKDAETAVSGGSPPKPVWADDEKPKSATKKKDDDEEEPEEDEDKPGPHWVFPGTLSTEVMALAREGIWFASLKGDDLKKALRMLKGGSPPGIVIGDKGHYIPWVMLTSIWCNRKLNGFTITYTNEGESTSKVMTPADKDERDEIMDAIEEFMKPDVNRKVIKHTAFTAMAAPILTIVVTFIITLGIAILTVFIGGDWEGRGRGAAVAALFNFLDWLGPLGSCGIGSIIGAFMLLWMVIRMANPPIEVTLTPVASKQSDEEEE